jgi:hypothetical protein
VSDLIVDFLDTHKCERRAYLGDGVYIGHDGWQLWLLTERDDGLHRVALDQQVQHALLTYLRPPPASPGTGDDEEADGASNGD